MGCCSGDLFPTLSKGLAYISWRKISNKLRAGFLGGEDTTVVGEKSPTSPAFCSSWDATFIRPLTFNNDTNFSKILVKKKVHDYFVLKPKNLTTKKIF